MNITDQHNATAANVTEGNLNREIGLVGAVMMGLGSIIGTGVFVSLGIGINATGPSIVLALIFAALIAICNGLSSAQLAAIHPVSGGTYEYGYRLLTPSLGFTAGWMFLCAKSASAATAALGASGYILSLTLEEDSEYQTRLAFSFVIAVTVIVLCGIRRSNVANIIIVGITLASLLVFAVAGFSTAQPYQASSLSPFFAPRNPSDSPLAGFLEATALMFVAFTGYGRIATLAEEVRSPSRTIPTAIIITLCLSTLLYITVASVCLMWINGDSNSDENKFISSGLIFVAESFEIASVKYLILLGGVTAMLGVLLNLILGLSRVLLAMGRRADMDSKFASVNKDTGVPVIATIAVAGFICLLLCIGDIKITWSFSAFTVLIYYAITNLAALRISQKDRQFPRAIAFVGLLGCLFLAFWIETRVWIVGILLIAIGLLWHYARRKMTPSKIIST